MSDYPASTRQIVSLLSTIALLLSPVNRVHGQKSQPSRAAASSKASASTPRSITDVRLNSEGTLAVSVLNSSGRPISGVTVIVGFQGGEVAKAATDSNGAVKVVGLRPGLHSLSAANRGQVFRFWTQHEAPPSAVDSAALVISSADTRGQYGPMMGYPMQPMMGPSMMAPGLLATTVTAAAVAIVIIGKSEGSDAVVVPASP